MREHDLRIKLNHVKFLLTEERRANTFSLEYHIHVNALLDDEMQDVLNFDGVISIAKHFYVHGFGWLQHAMLNHRLEDGHLVLREGMKVSLDFGFIGDGDFLSIVFKDGDLLEVKFLGCHLHDWTDRARHDVDDVRQAIVAPDDVDLQW